MPIAEIIRLAQERRGWSQMELAEQARVSRNFVQSLLRNQCPRLNEGGRRRTAQEDVRYRSLASALGEDALGMSVDAFLATAAACQQPVPAGEDEGLAAWYNQVSADLLAGPDAALAMQAAELFWLVGECRLTERDPSALIADIRKLEEQPEPTPGALADTVPCREVFVSPHQRLHGAPAARAFLAIARACMLASGAVSHEKRRRVASLFTLLSQQPSGVVAGMLRRA